MNMNNYKFDTVAIHGGYQKDATNATNIPLYLANAYEFDGIEHARDLFALDVPGNIYTRLQNPTNSALEERIALLEGGIGAVAFSSGHAAIFCLAATLAQQGDEIVASSKIYGGAVNQLQKTLGKFGVVTHFVDASDPNAFVAATNEKTRFWFIEAIGNPTAAVCDIEAIAVLAKRCKLPLVVDSTFSPPCMFRAIEHGADIVVHSSTKLLCGNGQALGGLVIDSGNFDWNNPRFPEFITPDNSYNGKIFAEVFGKGAFLARLRACTLRDIGATAAPFNSHLILNGIETLSLRVERVNRSAQAAAEYLEGCPYVERVDYPGLSSSPYHGLAKKYFDGAGGGVFTFEIKGGKDAGAKFLRSLKIFKLVANLGDSKSLVSHPALTTHAQLSKEQLASAGITDCTIRLSIGLEDVSDLIADLEQAFRA